ncbi:MAG TPA: hypothetical protein VER75_07540 [Thermoleophilaceae bacterium]|nr:hypothetical protein [Thermoleophilaceae bacterium]
MTTEGWIFMVGFRVFDVGLLVVWLIWFFRLRDDDDDSRGDGGGGEGPGPRPDRDGPGGGGIKLPLGAWKLGRGRVRDHSRRPGVERRRDHEPRVPAPARVRRPSSPVPAHDGLVGHLTIFDSREKALGCLA